MTAGRSLFQARFSPAERAAANRCYLAECECELFARTHTFELTWRSRVGHHTFRFCSVEHGRDWLAKHPEEGHDA